MARQRIQWSRITDEELLELHFQELPLRIAGTQIGRRVQRLYAELRAKGIRFQPHVWLSDEWFSPDDSPGIAIPFYLAHPRLIRLEERMMLHAEGKGEQECMRILRHEAGHAIDTAYQLHRSADWRRIFGKFNAPYPDTYKPRPRSKQYVQHLNDWYAQAHPAEDFAETFAVWLTPGARWNKVYEDWGALRKLQYVDRTAETIGAARPRRYSKKTVDEIGTLKRTLREHYASRQRRYAPKWPHSFDRDLKTIFSSEERSASQPSAAAVIRKMRAELRTLISTGTGVAAYTIDQFIFDAIERCKHFNLHLKDSLSATQQQLAIMLTVHTMRFLHAGLYRITL